MNEQSLQEILALLGSYKDKTGHIPEAIQAILQLHREDVQSKVDILFEKGFLYGDKEKDKVTFSYTAFNKFVATLKAEGDKGNE